MAYLRRFLMVVLAVAVFVWYGERGYFDSFLFTVYGKYSDDCDYCFKDGHGSLLCSKKAVDSGAIGRWVIPDVGVDVACYVPMVDAQKVTDDRDSAAVIYRDETTLLADHNYQGFNAIKKCEVGTIAYMDTGAVVKKYVCTGVIQGYNVGTHLTNLDGKVIESYEKGGYTAYTCNYFKDSITIVQFAPVL